MFKNLSLKNKIILLVLGATLSFAVLMVLVFIDEKRLAKASATLVHEIIQTEIEQKLKLSTDSLAQALGTLVEGKAEVEQIAIIAQTIEDFRFESDKSGYFFAYKEYTPVAHPTRKDLIGTSLAQTKDANGVFYVKELYQSAQNQTPEGKFVHFHFSKPKPDGSLSNAPKIAYATLIPHTENIWLSTGVYVDTLENYASEHSLSFIGLVNSTLSEALIGGLAVFIIIFLPLSVLFYRHLIQSVKVLSRNMYVFFQYLNHKIEHIELIPLAGKDELAQIANDIQENVAQIAKGLEKDKELVAHSLGVIGRAKEGYADRLIELKANNPQLNDLRNIVNELLNLLMSGVGKDLHEINRVFDSYT
ncbi:cache domain-containing protein, partial [Helicobacter marmotae]